jgi:hypothetical protein
MVVKAESEQGERLNIRKATLREWRRDFAQYLRDFGVEANATERAVRGQIKTTKLDGIHRAMQRNESTHMRARAEAVARELDGGRCAVERGKQKLAETRRAVLEGWRGLADTLDRQGQTDMATSVRRFAETMPLPRTEKEMIAHALQVLRRARTTEPCTR